MPKFVTLCSPHVRMATPSPAGPPGGPLQLHHPAYVAAVGAMNRRRKQLSNSSALAGVIIFSMVLFILSFATAASWVLAANLGIRKKQGFGNVAIFAACLTAVTIALAVVFGFTTKEWNLDIPVDTTSLLSNLDLSLANHGNYDRNVPIEAAVAASTPRPFSFD